MVSRRLPSGVGTPGVDTEPANTSSAEPRTMTVEEASEILGISRGHAYELIRRGELPGIRLGRRVVVPVRAIDDLLDQARAPESA